MKKSIKIAILSLLLIMSSAAKSQVLITLLFGEALNTPNIEFGLIGGMNRARILDIDGSDALTNWNLGFYFHILIKGNSFISTGVLVKSTVGAAGMATYPIGNADFDELFVDGSLTKKIHYFSVPVMYQYRFLKCMYAEGGFQVALRNKAFDVFSQTIGEGDLDFTLDVRDQYKYLDGGLVGGFGFKLSEKQKSTAIGFTYYYGLVNVSKTTTDIYNSTFNLYAKIPIGTSERTASEKSNN